MELDFNDLPFGVLAFIVFLSRVLDVSIGTIRMIATVQGRVYLAFVLGLFEVTIWLIVIATVVNTVLARPWLLIFYALGFSTGNVVGIILERKLALGHAVLRVITGKNAEKIQQVLRADGFRVTQFEGTGATGPVSELQIVCERKLLTRALQLVQSIDPEVFYLCETPTRVRRFGNQMAGPESAFVGGIIKRK
ncbi:MULTISPECIES: DUF2179 domain-containing protein [unclassified Lentimonas]|uniref:DUF2179 domain-containing protein n=1 Tax=unclassified Lentimonas TaxID=2630993 RepID=UPI001325F4F3|nr:MULTISPECIES: DUF5698 domain-containing protein [unclassified Lentimonas]CAA6679166.1 Unannotated [Lentimonas sp. CC4]CAA6684090.1 Unannotated [Lentimonas sp. CC6]CAA7076534.1 Unannotated [Lentimonas sp. CC4]CAA7172105.1 Unannotated [Lentimonas sp. CC21]CAA7183069.1 Unannotated [Lentimonas sp. CC8]